MRARRTITADTDAPSPYCVLDVEIPLPPILREVGAADDSDTRPAADTASALSLSAYAAADADAGEEKWNELALEQVSAQAAALRQ